MQRACPYPIWLGSMSQTLCSLLTKQRTTYLSQHMNLWGMFHLQSVMLANFIITATPPCLLIPLCLTNEETEAHKKKKNPSFAHSHAASGFGTEIQISRSGLRIHAIDLYSVITKTQSHLYDWGHFRLLSAQTPTKTKSFSTFNLRFILRSIIKPGSGGGVSWTTWHGGVSWTTGHGGVSWTTWQPFRLDKAPAFDFADHNSPVSFYFHL